MWSSLVFDYARFYKNIDIFMPRKTVYQSVCIYFILLRLQDTTYIMK